VHIPTISPGRARRLALTAQGLDRGRPGPGVRRDVRHLRRVLDAVDIVQLDSVNVLARAHELPFWARLGPHDRTARDRWLWRSGEAYEGWIHVASLTGVEVWPLLAHRRAEATPGRRVQRVLDEDPTYPERILEEVAERGPTRVRDLDEAGTRTGPWWGSPKGKIALDWLTATGLLAVHHRTRTFETSYDLAERVLPDEVLRVDPPSRERATELLLLRAARAHGIGTATDLADHHRLRPADARAALERLVDRGELDRVRVRGWRDEAYLDPEARTARTIRARTLLSPFDPVVWFRPRAQRLFGFHYRIEIYVPERHRVHGYYVLPFLLGDELVARVDLKADRPGGRLLVRGAFAEDRAHRGRVARELAAELEELATWLGLDDIEVAGNGDLAPRLVAALA
jgi:uncharacterized protein